MKRKTNGERGMSLVEVTIILMTLALLTSVLAPSIGDYLTEARQTKAKEDVEALGTALQRLVRDTGGRCVRLSGAAACTLANRVGILRSVGPDVLAADLAATATNATFVSGADNWDDDQGALSDTFDNQLVLNTPNYDTTNEGSPGGYVRSGPAVVGIGWRGAYIGGAETDPWGKPYLANTAYFGVATDAVAGYTENLQGGGYSRDVIVISAGPNGMFDSPFGGSTNFGTDRLGDDIIYVVQGDTR